jgi:8-amino-3,8-dideoxy-alpha-D-manno-octulosonate transaminase
MPGFEVIGAEERQALIDLFDKQNGILFRHGFDVLRKGSFKVLEFERRFAEYFGAKHALAVTSGTAAVKVGLKALGVGPGDEVVTQPFTFVATMEAIQDCGAVPVMANCDDTLNMSPKELERCITPRTKVVMPVHMLGVAADLDPIQRVCKQAGLPLFEENCESLGARYGGRYCGTIGKVGAFSLDFGKVITTGEGGMVLTDDEEVYKLAKEYHDHGHEGNPKLPRGRDTHRIAGFNYRMNEMQAAVGIAQLAKLDMIRAANVRNHGLLMKGLRDIPKLRFRTIPAKCEELCDTVIFTLPTQEQTRRFALRMQEEKIGTKNLPDAFEWHFAGYWDHIFCACGMSKAELTELVRPTYEVLVRTIALPIWVKDDEVKIGRTVEALRAIAKQVL